VQVNFMKSAESTEIVESGTDPALGFYVHVPFCRHICPYCDFYKVALGAAGRGARGRYARAVAREIDLLAVMHPEANHRPLASIYLGGGTPSSLELAHLTIILDAVRARFPLTEDCEITLEANPETCTPARLTGWHAAGFNRVSLGGQTFDDRLLIKIGRGHKAATVRLALRRARRAGFTNLSLDLMFALPGQTLESWMADIEETIAWAPEHISFYGLTLHPGTRFHDLHEAGKLPLPEDDLQADMYLQARRVLLEAGYEHYEISNFARPGFRARHNENYWTGGDWLAAGPGAHATLSDLRWDNPSDLEAWQSTVGNGRLPRSVPLTVTREERWTEGILLGLRRLDGLDVDALARRTGRDLREERRPGLDRFLAAELLRWVAPSRLALTERGLLLADSIMMELA
jgi:oxygen-independent coproporphyrinogen-3 oxidase